MVLMRCFVVPRTQPQSETERQVKRVWFIWYIKQEHLQVEKVIKVGNITTFVGPLKDWILPDRKLQN